VTAEDLLRVFAANTNKINDWNRIDSGALKMPEINATTNTLSKSLSIGRKKHEADSESHSHLSAFANIDFSRKHPSTVDCFSHEPSSGSARSYVTDCTNSIVKIPITSEAALRERGYDSE
jgi:hypothetical protein